MKVHIGCGTVYLKDWLNIDVKTRKTFLATDRPDLVERYITNEDDYYGRHQDKTVDSLREGPRDDEYVCDYFGDLSNQPMLPIGLLRSVDEMLVRQTFEHLSIREAREALDAMRSWIMPNGVIRIDVPDHEQTLHLFRRTGDEFYIRHLLGPRRNEYGYHMMSYTPDLLEKLVCEHGFTCEGAEENIHFYPAFCLRFRKV